MKQSFQFHNLIAMFVKNDREKHVLCVCTIKFFQMLLAMESCKHLTMLHVNAAFEAEKKSFKYNFGHTSEWVWNHFCQAYLIKAYIVIEGLRVSATAIKNYAESQPSYQLTTTIATTKDPPSQSLSNQTNKIH